MSTEGVSAVNPLHSLTLTPERVVSPYPPSPRPSSRQKLHSVDTRHQGMEIKHGVLADYSFRVGGHLHTVIVQPDTQTYVLHHTRGCSVYQRSSLQGEYEAGEVDTLLYAPEHCLYVGICKYHVKLLNRSFVCFFETESAKRIISAVFNGCSGEVLTSGPGNIIMWMFRQGAKVIVPSQVITDGLLPEDEVDYLHLEDVPGKAQRCFAAIDCGVKVFLLSSGKQLVDLPALHSHPITSLLFFRPLRLLITAAKDGAIKVWDSSWQLCSTFVGHCGRVTSLVPYPYGPTILSGSLDATIRVWNLSTLDQVEMLDHIVPVEGLHAQPGVFHLLSHSGRQVKAWRVQQLYTPTTLTGSSAHFLTATTHPKVPLCLLASCADSAVRVISSTSGHVTTTALLPMGKQIISTAYFALEELLFTLDHEGVITVFNTRANNPSAKMTTWTSTEDIGQYTCLALYEMAMDEEDIEELLSRDKWLGVTLDAMRCSRLSLRTKDPLEREREGYSMLLAGTSHGYLVLLDHNLGGVKFSVKAHQGPVSLISCNAKKNQVISTTTASSPSLMVATRERLCVACNNHQLSTYSIHMYNLSEQTSFTGQPDHDHTDTITALDAAPKLKLFASCGQDATIRIWTEDNHPVRVLRLDSAPGGLAFSSQQGDLTIALHSHLHTITNSTYFTEALMKQLVSMQFPGVVGEGEREGEREGGREFTVDLTTLLPEDRQRLELVDNTIQQDAYRGALSAEEMEWLEQAAREKAHALSLLQSRDDELKKIRDGKITSNRKHTGLKVREKEAAWCELLHLLHPLPEGRRTRLVIPEEDDFDPDTYGIIREKPEPYSPYTPGPRYKFFPPLAAFDPPYPIAPDGYLPNSVVLQLLRKSKADQELAEQWQPPTISDQQRRLMEEMKEEEEEEEEEEEQEDSDLMARLHAALTAESPKSTPSPTPPPSPPPSPPRRKIIPHKPIEKLIAPKAPPKPPTPPRTPTPPPQTPSPPPTPPPPPTPLPEYITQFIGQTWFDKLFPNASSKTFPRPWTVTRFVYTLLSCFSRAIDSFTSGDICSAILKLCQQHNPSNKEDIHKTIFSQLLGPPTPSPLSLPEQHFIVRALKLLLHLATDIPLDARLVGVMMAYCVEGGPELQQLVIGQLAMQGLEDVYGYFPREINKIATEGLPSPALLSRCQVWLDLWAEQLFQSRAPRLRKTAPPTKKALKGSSTVPRGKKTSTATHKVTFGEAASTLPPYDPIEVINYFVRVEHENELARQRVVTPPPPPPPDPEEELPHNTVVALPKITKPRSLIRLGETHCSCCHPERETSFALVHQLPPLYNTPRSQDPSKLWPAFTHCITLAIKPQNINPFLSEEERLEEELAAEQHKPSITSVMKYFVPDRSYVRTS